MSSARADPDAEWSVGYRMYSMAAQADGPSGAASGSYQKRLPTNPLLSEIVDDAISAITDEIAASTSDPANSIALRDGRYLGRVGDLDMWSFEADQDLPAAPETPATIKLPGVDPIRCWVVASDDLDVIIGTQEAIDAEPSHARLSLDPVFILHALRDRLVDTETDARSEHLLETLMDLNEVADTPIAAPTVDDGLGGLSAEQRGVVGRATRDGIQFVWGPPGTGKTLTLAAMVERLVNQGERVLILAHANAAVDVAMVRIAERMHEHPALLGGAVLRAGEPSTTDARANPWINPDAVLRRTIPALVQEHDQLLELRSRLARRSRLSGEDRAGLAAELDVVREKLSAVRARLTEERNRLISNAQVVGATLSRFAISDLIWDWKPGVIIIDEASMATNPFVIAAALRSPRTLALFGDFRQLPPIARSHTTSAERWLVQDVFQLAGVSDRIEIGRADDRLSVLQTQFRMGSDIGSVVSRFAYFNILQTHISADERAAGIAAHQPGVDSQLVIIDISTWSAPCLTDAEAGSFSRFNLPSALLSVSLASGVLKRGLEGVGVIAPYRAHARLTADLVRDEPAISAATTHRFQGAESDAIILDLVDSDPQAGPSVLTGADPALTRRLLNVAVSRARGKLMVLVDLDFIERHHPPASPVAQLLQLMREREATVIAPSDVAALLAEGPVTWYPCWGDAFASSLTGNPQHIDLAPADTPHTDAALASALEKAIERGASVTCRVPISALGELEELDMDIKLKTLGAGPIALVRGGENGAEMMVVGCQNVDAPAGVISTPKAVRAVWKLLTGEVMA